MIRAASAALENVTLHPVPLTRHISFSTPRSRGARDEAARTPRYVLEPLRGRFYFCSRISPPELRRTSFGPPPFNLPLREESSCLPRIVTGTSESTSPPLVCASMSRPTFDAMCMVMPPPEVERRDSPRG